MTKKKSIITKLFVALVALTLISCCFLGSTFARYTSGGNGSATTNIAKWDIDISGKGVGTDSTVFSTDKFSPSHVGYSDGTDVANGLKEPILIATIENKGDVDAAVTIKIGDTLFYGTDSKVIGGTDASATTFATTKYEWKGGALSGDGANEEQVKAALMFQFWYSTSDTWNSGTGATELTSGTGAITVETAGKLYVYANVVWVTNYSDDTASGGKVMDAIDTWIGENVTKISTEISYTAVQAETLTPSAASGD